VSWGGGGIETGRGGIETKRFGKKECLGPKHWEKNKRNRGGGGDTGMGGRGLTNELAGKSLGEKNPRMGGKRKCPRRFIHQNVRGKTVRGTVESTEKSPP